MGQGPCSRVFRDIINRAVATQVEQSKTLLCLNGEHSQIVNRIVTRGLKGEYSRTNNETAIRRMVFTAPINFQSQSDDPISCYRKPTERTTEIKGYAIPLVRSTGFL